MDVRRIKFKTVARNDAGPREADEEVIDTKEEYAAWMERCAGDREAFDTNVDFEREMLIAVSAGEQATKGHDLTILGIAQIVGGAVGVQWQVLYALRSDPGAVAKVQTYPQHVVRTKVFPGVVTFRRVSEPALVLDGALAGQLEPVTSRWGIKIPRPQPATTPEPRGAIQTTMNVGEDATMPISQPVQPSQQGYVSNPGHQLGGRTTFYSFPYGGEEELLPIGVSYGGGSG